MTSPKRKYNRLPPSTWAEICALWEIGDVTLPELSERYVVSTRTLQAHFAKHKVEKGSKSAALATSVKAEVFASSLGDKDLIVQRARDARETAYRYACVLEGLVMGTFGAMPTDPSKALGPTSMFKALALAASTIERTHNLKRQALGLDKDMPISDELPVLIFRDLSKEEITAIQDRDEDEEEEPFFTEAPKLAPPSVEDEPRSDDDDDIISEGGEVAMKGDVNPATEDKAVFRDAEGGRLVRGAKPD